MAKITIGSLESELRGLTIGDEPVSEYLIRILGEDSALNWFYDTNVPDFNNHTPHEICSSGKSGRRLFQRSMYYLLTGQPD